MIAYELLTGKLPYGKGFSGWRDAERRTYIPAFHVREDIPAWVDMALAKAVAKRVEDRTEASSELLADLERPNQDFRPDQSLPLMARHPAVVWRAVAMASVLLNLALLAWFLR